LKVVDPFHRGRRHGVDGDKGVGAALEGSSSERAHWGMFAGRFLIRGR
jgi:hypothetical protein